ncbi:MAG: TSUP family transporter [Oscillospiraceae bacterium]|nr:TSUP family transporter [Oscillospiraceae bacterium]
MISGYPVWVVLLIGAGVFCASFVDAIGGGGGIISVPVYLLAGLPVHNALATNKMSACLGTFASTFRYLKNGFVDWLLALPAVGFAVLGSYFGTRLQLMVDERYLKYMLLVVLPAVAFVMLRQKKFPEERGQIAPWVQRAVVWGAALVVGVYDGFYGPGTGTFLLLIYCNFAKMDLRTASGTVKVVNLSSNIGALATALFAGKVLVPIGLIAAVFSIAGHYLGAGMTIRNGAKVVRPVILAVLGLLAVKVILELLGV